MSSFLNKKTLADGAVAFVRPYTVGDYPVVKGLLETSGIFDASWDSEASLKKMIEQYPTAVLVATAEEVVVGSVYIHSYGNWAYLWRLATQPSYRNQGIATLILDTAEQVLKDRGVPEVAIFVNEQDGSLKDFYSKRGWQIGGVYRSMWKRV